LFCYGIDTTTAISRFTFNILATLADFEREIIRERTKAELDAIQDLELLTITHLVIENYDVNNPHYGSVFPHAFSE
jgi:DNA invertase Pin-like site-specific DNA recombinase